MRDGEASWESEEGNRFADTRVEARDRGPGEKNRHLTSFPPYATC